MSADVSARLAWPDDAESIAAVQLAGWRHDRRLPEEVLDSIDPAAVARQWADTVQRPRDARTRVLVALEGPTVRGLAIVHPSPDPDADPVTVGEIGELTIDPGHRGAGHGSRLMQAAVDTLRSDGFERATCWVLTTDDAVRGFVTASGWEADGAHRELQAPDGSRLKQVRLHTALA